MDRWGSLCWGRNFDGDPGDSEYRLRL